MSITTRLSGEALTVGVFGKSDCESGHPHRCKSEMESQYIASRIEGARRYERKR